MKIDTFFIPDALAKTNPMIVWAARRSANREGACRALSNVLAFPQSPKVADEIRQALEYFVFDEA